LYWHRDGGRMDADLGLASAPRLGVKVGYFASDTSTADRANIFVAPGSHLWPAPIDRERAEREQVAICAPSGSALVFDRRLVHTGSRNRSPVPRKAVFYGYTYRWISSMGREPPEREWYGNDPVRRQLLGFGDPYRRFFPGSDGPPLQAWLREHDPSQILS
jgi:ectoine hydroxylase-related dioxygenase (phytanoyl-CoA dioxygenase family)